MATNWICPHCSLRSVLTKESRSSQFVNHWTECREGARRVVSQFTVCPNPDCGKFTLDVAVVRISADDNGQIKTGKKDGEWRLRPQGAARVFPECVPAVLQQDYREACLIAELSPKASATLSRRVLQGMIRDFWGVQLERPTLWAEIKAIEDKIDPETWEAIKAVKDLGNIGAHMQQDINTIIEVDPDEAQMLIGLTETLFDEWYVARENRRARMAAIRNAAEQKKGIA